MLKDNKYIKNLPYWYTGGILFFTTIALIFIPNLLKQEVEHQLLIIFSFALGMLYISTPLSKIIASNRRFVAWYIRYKEKQDIKKWRANK